MSPHLVGYIRKMRTERKGTMVYCREKENKEAVFGFQITRGNYFERGEDEGNRKQGRRISPCAKRPGMLT
jgi:hypothetical protein